MGIQVLFAPVPGICLIVTFNERLACDDNILVG